MSSAPVAAAAVGARLAETTSDQCREAAQAALAAADPEAARTAVAAIVL